MDGSVLLSDLPYTGFDMGPIYNNLFWVALLIWSFVLARVLIKLSGRKVVQVSQKRVERKEHQLAAELARGPQILEERIIRYKDPGESTLVNTGPGISVADPGQWAARDRGSDALMPGPVPTPSPEVEQKVAKIIEEELAETREGESDDEFDEEDFERVDFDGVNPDVYWQPKPVHQPVAKSMAVVVESGIISEPVVTQPAEQPPQAESPKVQKHYKDTLKLDTSEEYPRMVLTREEVAPR